MSWKEIFSDKSPSVLPEIDLPIELAKLKAKGWLMSHRKDDTGIGKTIEDYLGIKENNLGEPDCLYKGMEIEIKGRRAKTNSMITLFTLEPSIRHLHDVELMKKYGYRNGKGRQALKITLTPMGFTPQGLKIEVDKITGSISIIDKVGSKPWTWTMADFHLKLHNLCIVYADSKTIEEKEYFKIRNAILATGLDDKKFFDLINKGAVKVDLRMHTKSNGGSRNHGTGFRLANYAELVNCYEKVESILGDTTLDTTLDAKNQE
jgi:hypothetical protein